MITLAHKTTPSNRTQTMRFYPYVFTGKEKDKETGYGYFGARYMDHELMTGWLSVDPLADKYPGISPYAYCMWNPVKLVDPDGKETYVAQNEDGTYRVIGGRLNNDRNIYLYKQDKNGEYTIRCKSIGKTTSTTSFYNSDANNGKGAWAIGSIIDPNDYSGIDFLNHIVMDNPPLFDNYMVHARKGGKYDFKVTNGGEKPIPGIDIYRGMPIGGNAAGETFYSSARDIGNIAAGYIAAANGMSWSFSRIAFDAYQSYISGWPTLEGKSTQNAEYYGWHAGYNPRNNSITQKFSNFIRSIKSWLR